MWDQILCYQNQGIHWYHCNPTFLWKINFTLVRSLTSALIWEISGLWNRSDGRDYWEKRIVISRFLTPYINLVFLFFLLVSLTRPLPKSSSRMNITLQSFLFLEAIFLLIWCGWFFSSSSWITRHTVREGRQGEGVGVSLWLIS